MTSYQKHHFPYNQQAVAVAMGTSGWDFMPVIVWVVHFAWAHEAESWFGGIHVCRYAAITSVRTRRVVVRLLPFIIWDNTAFIPHQSLVLFLCAVRGFMSGHSSLCCSVGRRSGGLFTGNAFTLSMLMSWYFSHAFLLSVCNNNPYRSHWTKVIHVLMSVYSASAQTWNVKMCVSSLL